jgi:hypothetical protein
MPAGWISAGAAVLGAGESIAAGDAASSAAKKNNANNAVLAGAQNTMLNQAQTVANQPFQAYTGDLTAPMSGNQQQAYSLASDTANQGEAQDLSRKGTGLIDQVAGSEWNADTAAKYMNPYTQDVTQGAIDNSNRSYLQSLAASKESAIGSGAFGGSRAAITGATLASDNQRNIGQLTAKGNADAYDNALKAWAADNSTKLNAAKAYGDAGNDITKMNSDQISDLLKTGGVSQVISQTNLSNEYGQFMRQQGWSAQQLQPLIQSVSSAKGSGAQVTGPQSNTANQLLGLGSTLAGLYGSSNSNSFDSSYNPNDSLTVGDIPQNQFSIDTSDIAPASGP